MDFLALYSLVLCTLGFVIDYLFHFAFFPNIISKNKKEKKEIAKIASNFVLNILIIRGLLIFV